MIRIQECLVSEDVIEQQFACNISACKGACCIEGDAGAPLASGEAQIIESHLEQIIPYMDDAGLKTLEQLGISETDTFDEEVTTCKPNAECTFVVKKGGSLQCAIELANQEHAFGFPKPVSCHLYPIRVKKFGEYHALNYHKWSICSAACERGKKEKISVFEFCKTALIRVFGKKWYAELEKVASSD